MQRVGNPFPLFLDQRGALVDSGKIYIGEADADPEVAPIDVFWDADLTIPAGQPLRTRGGVIVNNGAPAIAYVDEPDYSIRVRDADNSQISYTKSVSDIGPTPSGISYQPLADALTLLAGSDPSAFGIELLEAADANAVKTLLGVAFLALTGGTVSGAILRQGAGAHIYHNDASMVNGGLFLTASAAADPTSSPGQIWAKY